MSSNAELQVGRDWKEDELGGLVSILQKQLQYSLGKLDVNEQMGRPHILAMTVFEIPALKRGNA
jgi:hypothetical protein